MYAHTHQTAGAGQSVLDPESWKTHVILDFVLKNANNLNLTSFA